MPPPKTKFTNLYDSLPQDAQQSLVHKTLIPLIKSIPRRKRERIVATALRAQQRHATCPQLDLRSKRQEINIMLKELSKDTKRSYVMDSSNRNELLDEIVASLASWMNDVWSVVYEHNVDFAQAHSCLLFVCATLERLDTIRMGCKCALNTMYIPVTLRNKEGQVIKKFETNGALRMRDITLFIWRDMFLSILAYGDRQNRDLVPKMLGDIEEILGCEALIRMLYTQPKGAKSQLVDENESDWEDTSDSGESSTPDSNPEGPAYGDTPATVHFGLPHLHHWPVTIQQSVPRLRRHVQMTLLSAFETAPSRALYDDLVDMSRGRLRPQLLELLNMLTATSSDTFAVALDVYTSEHQLEPVLDMLNDHSHLLRPRDYSTLQSATVFISRHGHTQRALEILEAELLDTARATRHALLQSFSQMETPANRAEITQIVRTRSGMPGRRARVEAWVDAASTPGADQPNPMMFAAMVMGIGPMPGLSSDDDPYTYLDLDPDDPDLEDLRAEYRPDLKKRFESWADQGVANLENGAASLLSVYRKIIDMLPFLRAPDVAEEMISRIQDRASKQFVCDGLDALLAFVKVQRRKWRHEQKRQLEEANATAARSAGQGSSSSNAVASSSRSLPSALPHPISPVPEAGSSRSGKTLDPIPREDSPGPPPLERVPAYTPQAAPEVPQPPQPQPVATAPGPPNNDTEGPALPAGLAMGVDAILGGPVLPPNAIHPVNLLSLLLGTAQPPAPGAAQDPPPAHSSVDDVD